ncbi:unnamed protein product, partial [Discosporangium mesarthrocarpum]
KVLVCTSTLAWGVNFPAHLVVVKGTEFFDGKTQRYVDFPITDLLQVKTLTLRVEIHEESTMIDF